MRIDILTLDESLYFNTQEYEENKAEQLNSSGSTNNGLAWTVESVDIAFKAAGLTALEHYQKYGAFEGINPSDLFDTDAYYEDKAEALNSSEINGNWTAEKVESVFQQIGIDPITHYALYGASEDIFPTIYTGKTTYTDAVPLSGINYIDSLASVQNIGWNWNDLASTQGNIIYYAFPTSDVQKQYIGTQYDNFAALNENQKTGVLETLNELSSITGINFVETSDLSKANLLYMSASMAYPDVGHVSGWEKNSTVYNYKSAVYIGNSITGEASVASNDDLRKGTGNFTLVQHETGHALGLKHPFDGTITLSSNEDNKDYTMMSYTWDSNMDVTTRGNLTYGPYDIAALQYLYGTDGLGGNQGLVKV